MRIPLIILSILTALFIGRNPFLFGLKIAALADESETLQVISHHDTLDGQLELLRKDIGSDFDKYRNHCLRVFIFSNYFLPPTNDIPRAHDIIAVALAFHDVALWTDGELDYIDPSAAQMEKRVKILNKDELAIARAIVEEHHKVTDHRMGANESVNALVNAVRKGDWADFTFGIVRWDLPSALLEQAYNEIPELGFHVMLAGMGGRLSPDSLLGRLAVLKIFRW